MPPARSPTTAIQFLGGDDEYRIKEEAGRLARQLAPPDAGEFGVDLIEGDTANQEAALTVIGRLIEALFTVGLFGGEKLVWLKSTELFADTVTTRADAVKDALNDLGDKLKRGLPPGVTLLVSAIGCDRRRTVYKTIEKLGMVRLFEAPDPSRQHSDEEFLEFIQAKLRGEKKQMDAAAVQAFRELVAPDFRELANELEKLTLYVGARPTITATDVRAICSASRQAVIWELTDTLGARNLPAAIRAVENLLAGGENAIGVVMMLVGQFRLMLLARDLMDRNLLTPGRGAGGGFQYVTAFERLPETQVAHFPRTKEGKLPNAWRLYRCALAAAHFSTAELIRAMEQLLDANRQLTSTGLDERLVLEEALVKIAAKPAR